MYIIVKVYKFNEKNMSKKSADTIKHFFDRYKLPKTKFCELTGVSRASLYKYLAGEPIHPKKAQAISEAIKKQYRIVFPVENLID